MRLIELWAIDLPLDEDAYVIHCAGVVSLATDYSKIVHDVKVVGTRNIVDLCVRNKVRKLVYISSTSAIPERACDREIVEGIALIPIAFMGIMESQKPGLPRL